MKTKFDYIDRMILDILRKDGRESITKISEKLSLSNTGIKKRVAKLNKSGVFKIQGSLNLNVMDFKACIILLEVKNNEYSSEIIKTYNSCPYVFFIVEIIGSFNLLLGFYGNSGHDLNLKLKMCGPSNMEGVLHSKIMLISEFKYPKFLPLQIILDDTDEKSNSNFCRFKCKSCIAYNQNECKGCL